jgi:competence protein ComEC
LSADAAGFLAAVAFSAKESLTSGISSAMAASGTSFLATLYGMKMSILVFCVSNVLLGYVDRRVVFGIAIATALAFTAMVGAPVSAIRAAIMAVVALWARESGGVLSRRNALAFAASGLVLWNPTILLDVGFLASFGSVVGILYLAPPLWNTFHWTAKGFLNWRENVVMNLAAQLAIIPLIADAAGGFPIISFISGAILIIFLPLAVLAGWAIGFAGVFLRPAAFVIAPLAAIIAGISIGLIRFFAAFGIAVSIPWNAWTISLYYGCLIAFTVVFAKKKSPYAFAAAHVSNPDFAEKEWMPAKVGDKETKMDD